MKPRILIMITRSERGGAQIHVYELIKNLRNLYDFTLFVGEDGFLVQNVKDLGVDVVVSKNMIRKISILNDLKTIWEMVKLIRAIRPNLIHLHSSKAGLLGRFAAVLTSLPSIFTVHGWAFTEGTSFLRKLVAIPSEWVMARFGGRMIAVSEMDQRLAKRYKIAHEQQISVIHNGIPDTSHRANPGVAQEVRIAVVARFARQKDQPTLLRSIQLLSQQNVHAKFMFIGDGPTFGQCQALARELGLSENMVEFVGERDNIAEILANSHISVLPTNWEGLPISIIESMRAGLPIIATNVGGIAELISDGANGILVARGDSEAWAAALKRLIMDKDLRVTMGVASRRRFEREFQIERQLELTNDVYTTTLNAGQLRDKRLA